MTDSERQSFFDCPALDRDLPLVNRDFWASLIEHIESDHNTSTRVILDIGCHTGRLLYTLYDRFSPAELIGIEPLRSARVEAVERLQSVSANVTILDTSQWQQISDGSVDIVTCHEVLYLEPDLQYLMEQIRRILTADGVAYVVLGCHSENPLWAVWKESLIRAGHRVYDYKPLDIMKIASSAGLLPSVQPLRHAGWITYDPLCAEFRYPDIKTMFEHHYRNKLIFRFHVTNVHPKTA